MFLLADAVAQRSNCLKQQEAHVFSGRRCSAVADMLAHQPGGRVFVLIVAIKKSSQGHFSCLRCVVYKWY